MPAGAGAGPRQSLGAIGRDWCCWNAVFGPRGADGLPKPLWDGATGQIDRTVLERWKQYDLRLVLEKTGRRCAPAQGQAAHLGRRSGRLLFE